MFHRLDMCYTDPAQHPNGWVHDLDDLDRDLYDVHDIAHVSSVESLLVQILHNMS